MKITTAELIKDLKSEIYQDRWFAAEILGTKKVIKPSQAREISKIMMNSDIGEVLCWGLGQMKNKNYVSKIGKLLEHPDNYFKWRAADALKNISSNNAVNTLQFYLQKSRFYETRWRCAWALGEIGDIRSFEKLWNSSQDENRYVRWKSIWAISLLKGNLEKKIREKILSDDNINDYMLWRCLWVFGRIGNKNTVNWLKGVDKFTKNKSKYIRYQLKHTYAIINNK